MSKKPKNPRDDYYLKIRRYPAGRWRTVWLCKRDGDTHAAFLWGETLPAAVEEIVKVLGLPVEEETESWQPEEPIPVPGCTPVDQQIALFPEESK